MASDPRYDRLTAESMPLEKANPTRESAEQRLDWLRTTYGDEAADEIAAAAQRVETKSLSGASVPRRTSTA